MHAGCSTTPPKELQLRFGPEPVPDRQGALSTFNTIRTYKRAHLFAFKNINLKAYQYEQENLSTGKLIDKIKV